MTVNELRNKRAKTWETAKAFLDAHRNSDGILSAEDDATYNKMEQEISDLGREIARIWPLLGWINSTIPKSPKMPVARKPMPPLRHWQRR